MNCPYCTAAMTPKNIVLGWRVYVCLARGAWGQTCGATGVERVEDLA